VSFLIEKGDSKIELMKNKLNESRLDTTDNLLLFTVIGEEEIN
jgi:hypothetical protein